MIFNYIYMIYIYIYDTYGSCDTYDAYFTYYKLSYI